MDWGRPGEGKSGKLGIDGPPQSFRLARRKSPGGPLHSSGSILNTTELHT